MIYFLATYHCMQNNLFVGSISWDATDQDLKEFFESIGPVEEAVIIKERRPDGTYRSKGYGFVTFVSEEDAKRALEELNEAEFMGRKIFVKLAHPKKEGPKRDFHQRDDNE